MQDAATPSQTPLHDLHVAMGARMAAFAGYDMPIQYRAGILAEHAWTRTHAGLFDVSHMGQAFLVGPHHATTARALEALCPADVLGLAPGRQRYSQLLATDGGILDDFMVARPAGADGLLALVVNAGRKHEDYAHLREGLPANVRLEVREDRALLALQGPQAANVIADLGGAVADMAFMEWRDLKLTGVGCEATRSGYTGEDGFELSVAIDRAADLWALFCDDARVKPVGLGARDSLRLEAGLCLYGHDIDETNSPVEAALAWSIGKRRRAEGGFPGAERILREIAHGPARRRVGLVLEGRQPAREGAEIATADGTVVGVVTSGGFAPTLERPIAMGYAAAAHAIDGAAMNILVRGKPLAARIAPMPFVPHRYKR